MFESWYPCKNWLIMNITATLGKKGFYCPHCGEFIEISELDCDDIYDIEMHGDTYFECPYCHGEFFVDECNGNEEQ